MTLQILLEFLALQGEYRIVLEDSVYWDAMPCPWIPDILKGHYASVIKGSDL
jgi:hypothetical protein